MTAYQRPPRLKIGEVARKSGVSVEALRFYERSRLIEPAGRTASGYRLYDLDVFQRLDFIKKAQSIGFSLEEIERIIRESSSGHRPCTEVRRIASERLQELERRLEELTRYRDELRETLAAWEEEGESEGIVCGLIEGLHPGKPRPPRRESL